MRQHLLYGKLGINGSQFKISSLWIDQLNEQVQEVSKTAFSDNKGDGERTGRTKAYD